LAWTPFPGGSDRVTVWSSQLAAGDFPPVCAMSGLPAETRPRFRFFTAPVWAVVLYFLLLCLGIGFFVGIPLAYLVANRASGTLPLTRRSKRLEDIPLWLGVGALVFATVLGVLGLAIPIAINWQHDHIDSTSVGLGVVLFFMATPFFVFGVVFLEIGLLRGGWLFGPRAKVMKQKPGQPDRVVELFHVHPAFVAAVRQMQAAPLPQSTATN